jgi:uroporphyrinogen-III synthase
MRPVLIVRPEAEAQQTAAHITAMGFTAIACPVTRIMPCDISPIDTSAYDALLLTSPHALTESVLGQLPRSIAVYCVGARAAARATEQGFNVVHSAPDAASLGAFLSTRPPLRALYLSAEDISQELPATTRIITYRAEPLEALPEAALEALYAAPFVLLTSVRSTTLFITLLAAHGVRDALRGMHCLCISPAVAQAAQHAGAAHITTADASTEQALIAALRASC